MKKRAKTMIISSGRSAQWILYGVSLFLRGLKINEYSSPRELRIRVPSTQQREMTTMTKLNIIVISHKEMRKQAIPTRINSKINIINY